MNWPFIVTLFLIPFSQWYYEAECYSDWRYDPFVTFDLHWCEKPFHPDDTMEKCYRWGWHPWDAVDYKVYTEELRGCK
jgi:hypothetical protein